MTLLSERPATDLSWSAAAFGLDVRGSFTAPGLSGLPPAHGLPRVDVARVSEHELAGVWPADGLTRVLEWNAGDPSSAHTIDWHADAGYRIFAAGYGQFLISGGGSRIECAPAQVHEWQWQRYLTGRLLPMAAVQHGYELLHASAVRMDGRAVAFAANSQVGKSSLALNLVLRGHRFITDDVVALSLRGGRPVVHPGPAVTNLRHAESERMGPARRRLGALVGGDEHGLRVALEREDRTLPLGALYVLDRDASGGSLAFERVAPGFRLLFESGFDFVVSNASRLENQLDVFAALDAHVPVYRVSVPATVDAAELAAHVEAHAADV